MKRGRPRGGGRPIAQGPGPQTIAGGTLGAPIQQPSPPGLAGTIGQGGTMPMPMPVPPDPGGMARTMPVGPPMSAPPIGPPGFGGSGGARPIFPPQIDGFQPNPAGDGGRQTAARRALMGLIRQG